MYRNVGEAWLLRNNSTLQFPGETPDFKTRMLAGEIRGKCEMKRFFSHGKISDVTCLDPEAWLVESSVQT